QRSSIATDPADCGRGAGGSVASVRAAVRQIWPTVDSPRAIASRSAVAGLLSVRSELQLMEQLDYNLLFRWFVGLSVDAKVWDETVFTKNRERLIEGDIARKFMTAVLNQGSVKA